MPKNNIQLRMCPNIPHLVVPGQSQLIDKLSLHSAVFNGTNAEVNTKRKFNNHYQSDAPNSPHLQLYGLLMGLLLLVETPL